MIKAILFDLDGTLLPMDQDIFVKKYFKLFAQKFAKVGYEPNKLIESMWIGTKAMIFNDGKQTNEAVFWKVFMDIYGDYIINDQDKFESFYLEEFELVKDDCGYNPKAAESIKILKERGYRLVLATNPIFPFIGTESRMRWAGLNVNDFELITTYENIGYCKPNIKYYEEILRRLDLKPEECVMVGNDTTEDMVAEKLGMKVFLHTDCLINKSGADISVYPHGGFDEMLEFLK